MTGNCNIVHLNINNDTSNLSISLPDNEGSLYINIGKNIDFDQNIIKSISNKTTNNLIIDCNGDCSENMIYGENINGKLNFSCIGDTTNCNSNTIHCPDSCNIDCDDCSNTEIKVNNINNINWKCNQDCTDSSIVNILNNDALGSWHDCNNDEWILLNNKQQCDDIINNDFNKYNDYILSNGDMNLTSSGGSDDGDLDQFTILAFVLIGTVIGCLCVIVVTTIICCICWHEHQIKAINMKATDSDNVNNIEPANNIQRDRTTPSPPGSTQPSPKSTPKQSIGINGYIPQKSQSPESNAINASSTNNNHTNGHSNTNNSISSSHKRNKSATKNPIIHQQSAQKQSNVSYIDENDETQDRERYRKMSQKQRTKSQRKNKHKKTGSQSVTNTTTATTRNISETLQQPQPSQISAIQQQQHSQQQQQQQQIKRKTRKVTWDEAQQNEEAKDGLAPLKHDIYGSKFDEHGNYNKYAGREQNKQEIKMALEAFPSNISGGTTRTEEMNFVGSNYNQYNPNDQINSYFKEDYEHAPINGYASDNLSLGNLDSGTTVTSSIAPSSIAPSSIAPSSIAMGPVTPTIDASKQQQHQHQYQGQYHAHQGHRNTSNRNGSHRNVRHRPNNIKIIKPQNAGKVRAKQQRNNVNNDGDDQSPTLTYTSGNDPPIHENQDANYYTPDSPDTNNQGYRD